ncbi:MAG: DNA mismatch repair endonuclease MutL [Candidatus Gracilibacteria bacterium]|nr:DNA mismatch repair endonuclease MutL [Candidatus Gracilibacteria bacterium]
MGIIQKLPKVLANQIAAGEVVERPISVVKELVENSIDAGSTFVKVEIKEGGIKEIIITDNGKGIDKDDLSILTEKHTTSKIKNLEDLHKVMTFGFRGEALASISSVSKFKILTKKESLVSAFSMEVIDGERQKIKEDVLDVGTKIIVSDLFYNTPARLNYLKKEKTEYSHIYEFLNNIALAYPNIGFEFVNDGKVIFKYKENEDLKTRIYNIYGDDFYNNLLSLDFEFSGVSISGYISNPKVSFSNKNRQVIFVNGRIITSPLIYKAINEAYNRFIPHGMFPGYIVSLVINPEEIDVNVHPRKQEIRFAREQDVYKLFYNAIFSKLENSTLTKDTSDLGEINDFNVGNSSFSRTMDNRQGEKQSNYYIGSGTKFKSYSPYKDVSSNPSQFSVKDAINFSKELLNFSSESTGSFEKSTDLHDTSLGKIVGQVFNSYIIVEDKDKLLILDQHALAERIIYENLSKKDFLNVSQKLLVQESFMLTSKEISILENYKQVFIDMGFDFEILSGLNVMLSAIPNFMKNENIKDVFLGIVSDIGEFNSGKSVNYDEVKNKIWAYTACRSAVKFGNKLNLFEMNKLLNDSVLTYSSTCPHGRPVIFEILLQDLKKKYDR